MSPPGDRREPPADTKCPPAAQRKQAKRACNCIRVQPDKSLDLSALSHSSDTVWEINTDQFDYAKFATLVYVPDDTSNGVFIKLKVVRSSQRVHLVEMKMNKNGFVTYKTSQSMIRVLKRSVGIM